DGFQFAWQRFRLDHGAQRNLLAARELRHELVPHAWRDGPPEALRVDGDAGRGNDVDAAVGIQRAVADGADRAALRGQREDLGDAARTDGDLAFDVLALVVRRARADADVHEL